MPTCIPDDTDWTCFGTEQDVASIDPFLKHRAEALAWSSLSALTGFRLSLCPTLLRPCLARCGFGGTWEVAPVMRTSLQPFVSGGRWYNACGCIEDCSCSSLCEIIMPAEVGAIDSIWMDGALLDPGTYRVDHGKRLVRTDGECWPLCQDMTNSDPTLGGLFVSYYPGVAPNELTRYAAGLLASEFLLACTGGECRLPSGVTQITRSGISMQVPTGMFVGNSTGIPEVDAVIRIYNPSSLKGPSRVLSPDRSRGRIQTWGA